MTDYIKKVFGITLMSLLAVPEMEAHAQEVVQSVDQSTPEVPVEEAAAPVLDYSVIEQAEQALAAELPAEPVVEEAPVVVEETIEETTTEEVGPEKETPNVDEEVSKIVNSNNALVEESADDSNVTSEPVDEEAESQVEEVVIRDVSVDTQSNQSNGPPEGKTLEQVRLEVAEAFGVSIDNVEMMEINGEFVIMNNASLMTYANLTDNVTGGTLGFQSGTAAQISAGSTYYGYQPLTIRGSDGSTYTVFCIEPWQDPVSGSWHTAKPVSEMTGSHYMVNGYSTPLNFTKAQMTHAGRIIEYGYNEQPTFNNWYYTQAMLWEYLGSISNMNYGTFTIGRGVPHSGYAPFKAKVNSKLASSPTATTLRPSFNGQSISTLTSPGQSTVLTDRNNVLQHLNIPSSSQGYSFSVSGNRLTITRNTTSGGTVNFSFGPKPGSVTPAGSEAIIFTNTKSQDVMLGGAESAGRTYQLSLVVSSSDYNPVGNLVIYKNNEQGERLQGARFEVRNASKVLVATVTTNATGNAVLLDLPIGTYTVREISAPAGYKLDVTANRTVSITGGSSTGVTFVNERITGGLTIRKTNESGQVLQGAEFEVRNSSGTVVGTGTTNASGVFTVTGLAPGTYTVRETKAPTGYNIDVNPNKTVSVSGDSTASVTFVNELVKGGLSIRKTNESGQVLQGAEFEVRNSAGTVVGTGVTNASGVFTLSDLVPGSYTVRETKAPAGYDIDVTANRTVSVTGNGNATVTFVNSLITGGLTIRKTSESGEMLQGAEFEVRNSAGTVVGSGATNAQGVFTVNGLLPGKYTVRETRAPSGYKLDVTTSRSVTVPQDGTGTVTFVNELITGGLTVRKTSESGQNLQGAEFEVRNASNEVVGTGTTNASGVFTLNGLVPGSYTVRETRAPSGYKLDVTPNKTVTVSGDGTASVTFVNELITGGLTIRKTNDSGQTLQGATFEVRNSSGTVVGTGVTNASGVLTITGLVPGSYTVRETKAPTGYDVDVTANRTVSVTGDATATVTFVNQLITGGITIRKTSDSGDNLAGAVFEVRDSLGTVVGTGATNAQGIFTVNGLVPGAYTVRETQAPTGYKIDVVPNKTVNVTGHDTSTVTFVNELITGSLRIEKTSEGGDLLPGAVFEVRNASGQVVKTGTTNNEGIVEITGLVPGSYTVVETQAPNGYAIDVVGEKTVTIVADLTTDIGFVNELITGNLRIQKSGEFGDLLPGAGFELVNAGTGTVVLTGITDSNGVLEIRDLIPGSYIVREIMAPEGYELAINPEQTTTVIGNNTVSVNFTNDLQRGNLRIEKINTDGEALQGAVFEVREEGTNALIGTGTTNADGVFIFTELIPGSYIVRETRAPEGYRIDVRPNRTASVLGNNTTTVTFVNEPITGGLRIEKTNTSGEFLEGAVFEVRDAVTDEIVQTGVTNAEGIFEVTGLLPGSYIVREAIAPAGYAVDVTAERTVNVLGDQTAAITFVNELLLGNLRIEKTNNQGEYLQGAVFEVRNAANQVVGTGTTNAQGVFVLNNLVPGTYTVRETQAPNGYYIDVQAERTAEINAEQTTLVSFVNQPITGGLRIEKTNESGAFLEGAVFEVRNADTDEVITTGVTNANGIFEVTGLLPGSYIVREAIAPAGYAVDVTDERTVTITGENTSSVRFVNQLLLGHLRVEKTNNTGDYLQGAEFEVVNSSGVVVGTGTTNAQGVFVLNNLVPGAYTVRETRAPEGYHIDVQPERVTEIVADQMSFVSFVNQPITGGVRIEKTNESGEFLEGAVFEIRDAVSNEVITTGVTNAEGIFEVTGLLPGSYIVREAIAPEGYRVDVTDERTVTVTGDAVSPVTFVNELILGHLRIEKTNPEGELLEGAVFEVRGADGTIVGTGTTNAEGVFVLNNLRPGTYSIRETQAPAGYEIDVRANRTAIIQGDETTTVVFVNQMSRGGLIIQKTSETGQVLEGAVFEIRNANDDSIVFTGTTNAQGTFFIDGLEPGLYIVRETIAPEGYYVDVTAEKTISVTAHNTASLEFVNKLIPGHLRIEKTDEAGNLLEGAEFEVRNLEGALVGFGRTNSEGVFVLNDLTPGTYTVHETKAPEGYRIDVRAARTTEIVADQTSTVTFVNELITGGVRIEKTNTSGDYLEGAIFEVRDAVTNEVIQTGVTNVHGIFEVVGLKPGSYVIRETIAPEGYHVDVTDERIVNVTGDNMSSVTFINELILGHLRIEKTDESGNLLQGAEFEVRNADGNIVGTGITNAEGVFILNNLAPGSYTVRETKAPEGYRIDVRANRLTEIIADQISTVTFVNELITGGVRIEKTNTSGDYLEGAIFEVRDAVTDEVIQTGVTNNQGIFEVVGLKPGSYIIRETIAPEGYHVDVTDERIVNVTGDNMSSVTFVNELILGHLRIEKTDEAGNLLQGAVFEVHDTTGRFVGSGTTNADGVFILRDLAPGSYIVKETQAPEGYRIDVRANRLTEIIADQTSTVTFVNELITGGVRIEKTGDSGELLPGAVFEIRDGLTNAVIDTGTTNEYGVLEFVGLKPGSYIIRESIAPEGYAIDVVAEKIVNVTGDNMSTVGFVNNLLRGHLRIEKTNVSGELLPGAVFEVRDSETDIVVGRGTTNAEGVLVIRDLVPGTYIIRETQAPAGYVIDIRDERTTEIIAEQTSTVTFVNEIERGHLRIEKSDKDTGYLLPGAEFEIFAYETGAMVGSGVTDYDGILEIRDLLPGRYIVRETQAPEGYVLDIQGDQTFVINSGEVTLVEFENEYITGHLEVIKKNERNTRLEGVEFALYELVEGRGSYRAYPMNLERRLVGTFVTDAEGMINIGNLEIGRYILVETRTLPGYVENTEVYEIDFTNHDGLDPIVSRSVTVVNVEEVFIGTSAIDTHTRIPVSHNIKDVTIEDRVSYENLVVGKQYTISGILMDKATNAPLLIEGEEIRSTITFIAERINGSIVLPFTFDARALAGSEVVVFEKLFRDGEEVAAHEDIDDVNQTVRIIDPSIETTATNQEDHSKEFAPLPTVTIRDTVRYYDLVEGEQYIVFGYLMDKETNSQLLINGSPITASSSFMARDVTGTVDVLFTFNAVDLQGKELVVFQDLTYRNHIIASHHDIDDEGQTIRITDPEIGTQASTKEDGTQISDALTEVTIVDEVLYSDLIVGKRYTVDGILMVKSTNTPFLDNGREVTASRTFIAPSKEGSIFLEFTFNASSLQGESLVVFESLSQELIEIATHHDINDENQTIYFRDPEIGTTATSEEDGGKEIDPLREVTISDRVDYTDLSPGKVYVINGILMDKATNAPLLVEGQTVTQTLTFVPESENGFVTLDFTFSAYGLHGREIVVFEDLMRDGTMLATHYDINDEGQTVRITHPEIGTTATNEEDGSKVFDPLNRVTLTDRVEYTDLIAGKEYTIHGVLMDKATNDTLKINGEEIRSSATFIAPSKNGFVDVTFTFNASGLHGKEIVVFEDLRRDNTLLAVHHDINDAGQTVRFTNPEIGTTATNKEDDSKVFDPLKEVTLTDRVEYTDLIVGKEYTVNGVLMDKTTYSALLVNGEEVRSSTTFIAESVNGFVTVDFTFDASALHGKEIVVFEELVRQDTVLTVHHDMNDEGQTVRFTDPEIGTTATNKEDDSKVFDPLNEVTLSDRVEYSDLIVGKEYTINGILMDKATNSGLLIDGQEVRSSVTFIAPATEGFVTVDFTFNASSLHGREIVVFEELVREDTVLTIHHDINDEGQTVRFTDPEIGTFATNKDDGYQVLDPLETITITDRVDYTDLIVGKEYTLNGILMDKATNAPILIDGEEVRSSVTFIAPTTEGFVNVDFTFNAMSLRGKEVVVFEELVREDTVLTIHHDINDEAQTVRFTDPEIGTTATSKEDGGKLLDPLKEVTVSDRVEYTDLIVGKTYILHGVLMDKVTNTPLVVNGEEVRQSVEFIAESVNGFVTVDFTFNAEGLHGKQFVVFEDLEREGTLLAIHHDINDLGQTIEFTDPEIGTTATNKEDGSKVFDPLNLVTITDRVEYVGLLAGKEYTVDGVLMDKATNTPILIDGEEVRSSLTFIAPERDGFVTIDFTFNASSLHGKEVVVFENLSRENTLLTTHHDINDLDQTVRFTDPEIGTTATNKEDGSKLFDPLNEVTITDRVEYTDLIVGKEYTISGVLMDKATNAAILVNGEEVRSSTTFIAETVNGFVTVDFTFDASSLHGKEIVVFEDLIREDTTLTIHHDINDEAQTVRFTDPEIGTTATNKEDGSKLFDPLNEVTITDRVEYTDLIVGKEYTISGVLMDKATNAAILVNGEEVRSSVTFIAESVNGFVTVDFTFDASSLHGKEVVVFEDLIREDTTLTIHHDINDEAQTVRFTDPEIGTTATNKEDGAKVIDPLETITITDRVEYTDLIVGKEYTLNGVLMDKTTGEALLVNGETIRSSVTFIAESANGFVTVDFTLDASSLHGKELVVFEELVREDTVLTVHHDINDEGQTVRITNPEIGTTATNKEDGSKELDPLEVVTITDRVDYTDLIVGKEYTVSGVLMDKETGEALLVNGEEVRSSVTFIAESVNGFVTVDFTLDASLLHGKEVVVFEDLVREGTTLTIHHDINDESQTVRFTDPEIGTSATNKEDGLKVLDPLEVVTISDRVEYTDLIVGKEYTLNGVLMDKETGEILLVDGEAIRSTVTFIAPSKDGFVTVDFTLNASSLHGKEVVVFEELVREGTVLTVHHDINDEGQTVRFTDPEIGTTATNKEDGSKELDPLNVVTITDRVDYTDLIVGKEYTVSGVLMDKETGGALLVNGEEIRSSVTFVAESANGFVTVDFTLDASTLHGKEIVVFEDLIREGTTLTIHHDINDESQTVQFTDPEIGTTATNKEDGTKVLDPLEVVTITDRVEYSDLIVGKEYTVNGVLMDKETGEALLVNGEAIRSTVTFIAPSKDGFVTVDFTLNASSLHGKELVVFEELVREGTVLTVHHDINDEGQTVQFTDPEIGTTATNKEDGSKELDPLNVVTITDRVDYTDLIVGKEYTISGVLMDKATGEALLVNGEEVRSSVTFIAESEVGFVTVDFTLNASTLHGKEVVVFEDLIREGTTLTIHHDINDESQTVRFTDPEIGTTATNKEDGLKVLDPLEVVTITDRVEYTDLIVGKEYTVNGVLMDKETGHALLVNGEEIRSSVTFIAESVNGFVTVDFTLNASALHGKQLVVFEELVREGTVLTVHHDINDEGQTVRITNPEIGTTATNKEDGSKELDPLEVVTITDRVDYTDLIVGKEYTISGVLMDKATGEALLVNGEEIRSSVTFIAESEVGFVTVDFTLNASTLHGKEIVVFEDLIREGTTVTVHHDINDESQTVRITNPEIGTTATNKEDGTKVLDPLEAVTISDRVEYTDLIVGKEYTINGILMDKETGEALLVNGEAIHSTVTFIAPSKNGFVTVDFVLNAAGLHGKEVVVFEELVREGTVLTVHHDINDEGQTVEFTNPEIGTIATEKETGNKEIDPVTVIIQDEVMYEGLIVGKEYTMTGWLMVKETNEPLVQNGQRVEVVHTFIPETSNGSVFLDFEIDASMLRGQTLVAFESLSREGTTIAIHHDIEDEDQSVKVTDPEIGTTATVKEDGLSETNPLPQVTIRDEVAFTDLIVGQEYTINGWLMVKETNEPLIQNGERVTATHTFIAESKDGSVFLDFIFDASVLKGQSVVVFETLSKDDVTIATHHDIEDLGQTVRITEPEIGTTATNKEDDTKVLDPLEVVTISDRVEYSDLIIGKEYTLNGQLMDKSTGEVLVVDGEIIESSVTFIAESTHGFVTVDFTFNASGLHGKELVVFEDLVHEGAVIAIHHDINDAGQTVEITNPEIGTIATEKETGNKEVDPVVVTIQDEVLYEGLIVGKEYTMTGWLMVKGSNSPLVQNGQRVESTITFIPTSENGSVFLDFVVDVSSLRGETLVVFETLSREGTTLAIHHDINDEDQSVRVTEPNIGTEATVKEDGLKVVDPLPEVVIRDEVMFEDLIVGQEYTINGWLMVKETNEPLVQNGQLVSASYTFIAESKNGSVFLDFVIDATLLRGQSVVAFETLSKDGVEIAVHHDINDEKQTVEINNPEVGTQASVDGEKEVLAEGEVIITDIVSYSGLTPGKEYELRGWLMRKSTNEPLLYNGEMITSSLTFVPESSEGEVEMTFVIPDASIVGNDSIVVFEELLRDGTIIAEHKDIDDEGQTVTFTVPDKPGKPGRPSLPPTGEARFNNYTYLVLLLLLAGLFGLTIQKKRRSA